MFILDTNVVPELRKAGTGKADCNVTTWADSVAATTLFLSAITILELETGVFLMERRDKKQGALLRAWLDDRVLPEFAERVLSVDRAVALRCAALKVPDPRSDRDALIAGTAIVHRMTIVTRNVRHFADMPVETLNP